jgi:hypothetical protein
MRLNYRGIILAGVLCGCGDKGDDSATGNGGSTGEKTTGTTAPVGTSTGDEQTGTGTQTGGGTTAVDPTSGGPTSGSTSASSESASTTAGETTAGETTAGESSTGGTTSGGDLRYFTTCGDPVCSGHDPQGVRPCGDQVEGAPCEVEGETCDPINDCNQLLVCAASDPKRQMGGCPISRARFKQDIRYLEPDELRALHAELRGLRLATYRYRDVDPSPPRLGIILDDHEQAMWVDAAHDRVDVYGYASLAVAAAQVQADELAALRAELAGMQRELAALRARCGE